MNYPSIDDRSFYVEARVGSENHRNGRDGEPCRAVWKCGSYNVAADQLIRDLVAEIERLKGRLSSTLEPSVN